MSTFPIPKPVCRSYGRGTFAGTVCLARIYACCARVIDNMFTMLSFWTLWTTDPLKSIGMIIPVVSFVLVLRHGEALAGDRRDVVGAALLLVTMFVVRIQQQSILILVISPRWSTELPPPSLMLSPMLSSGFATGGVRLYRAALFL